VDARERHPWSVGVGAWAKGRLGIAAIAFLALDAVAMMALGASVAL
jgi:hypothetical protein